ncbi:MAG TPA: HAD family hydrolase [Planktothrix sp.]|jgi:phosphoglycolate phosphatase-like HAD superfamily hydrolase
MKRLVLFDIDETMISSDGAGRRAIARILNQNYGVPESAMHVPMSGKTDPQILREIFKACGKEGTFESHTENIFELYLGVLEEEIDRSRYYIIHEGVVQVLDALVAEERAYLGLLTGNIERGAQMKLHRFDLLKYFPIGAFGSDSANRLDLPAVAQKRAKTFFKIDFAPHEVVIIGDAINDILCAKHHGAISIAVNTGRTTWEELEEQQPDYLFKSLKDTDQVLKAIFSEKPSKTQYCAPNPSA